MRQNFRTFPDMYTPESGILTKKYGHLVSRVYGKIWLYEGGRDGVCRATLSRIADDLCVGYSSVQRAVAILCQGGYLLDRTPGLRNRPHLYQTTDKLREETSRSPVPSTRSPVPTESFTSTDEDIKNRIREENESLLHSEQSPAVEKMTERESGILDRLEKALGYKIIWKRNRSNHAKFLLAEESNGYSVEAFTKNLPDERRAKVARFEEDLPEDWKRYGRLRSVAHYLEGV